MSKDKEIQVEKKEENKDPMFLEEKNIGEKGVPSEKSVSGWCCEEEEVSLAANTKRFPGVVCREKKKEQSQSNDAGKQKISCRMKREDFTAHSCLQILKTVFKNVTTAEKKFKESFFPEIAAGNPGENLFFSKRNSSNPEITTFFGKKKGGIFKKSNAAIYKEIVESIGDSNILNSGKINKTADILSSKNTEKLHAFSKDFWCFLDEKNKEKGENPVALDILELRKKNAEISFCCLVEVYHSYKKFLIKKNKITEGNVVFRELAQQIKLIRSKLPSSVHYCFIPMVDIGQFFEFLKNPGELVDILKALSLSMEESENVLLRNIANFILLDCEYNVAAKREIIQWINNGESYSNETGCVIWLREFLKDGFFNEAINFNLCVLEGAAKVEDSSLAIKRLSETNFPETEVSLESQKKQNFDSVEVVSEAAYVSIKKMIYSISLEIKNLFLARKKEEVKTGKFLHIDKVLNTYTRKYATKRGPLCFHLLRAYEDLSDEELLFIEKEYRLFFMSKNEEYSSFPRETGKFLPDLLQSHYGFQQSFVLDTLNMAVAMRVRNCRDLDCVVLNLQGAVDCILDFFVFFDSDLLHEKTFFDMWRAYVANVRLEESLRAITILYSFGDYNDLNTVRKKVLLLEDIVENHLKDLDETLIHASISVYEYNSKYLSHYLKCKNLVEKVNSESAKNDFFETNSSFYVGTTFRNVNFSAGFSPFISETLSSLPFVEILNFMNNQLLDVLDNPAKKQDVDKHHVPLYMPFSVLFTSRSKKESHVLQTIFSKIFYEFLGDVAVFSGGRHSFSMRSKENCRKMAKLDIVGPRNDKLQLLLKEFNITKGIDGDVLDKICAVFCEGVDLFEKAGFFKKKVTTNKKVYLLDLPPNDEESLKMIFNSVEIPPKNLLNNKKDKYAGLSLMQIKDRICKNLVVLEKNLIVTTNDQEHACVSLPFSRFFLVKNIFTDLQDLERAACQFFDFDNNEQVFISDVIDCLIESVAPFLDKYLRLAELHSILSADNSPLTSNILSGCLGQVGGEMKQQ